MKKRLNEVRSQRELLIMGCKEMAQDMLKITKEWEITDSQLDWEYKAIDR